MDWTARIRAAFEGAAHVPDPDVIEELAQHARAMYEAARADGLSHEEANDRVSDQLDRWRLESPSLRHTSRPMATAVVRIGLTNASIVSLMPFTIGLNSGST